MGFGLFAPGQSLAMDDTPSIFDRLASISAPRDQQMIKSFGQPLDLEFLKLLLNPQQQQQDMQQPIMQKQPPKAPQVDLKQPNAQDLVVRQRLGML